MQISSIFQEIIKNSFLGVSKREKDKAILLSEYAKKEFLSGKLTKEEFNAVMDLHASVIALIKSNIIQWYINSALIVFIVAAVFINILDRFKD